MLDREHLLELCKLYGIKVTENSDNPGMFLQLEDGTLREFTTDDLRETMNEVFGEPYI